MGSWVPRATPLGVVNVKVPEKKVFGVYEW
jgi:hypothetical protein